MSKFKKQAKGGFLTMSIDPFRDRNLSWTEMGLLGFLMSCNDSFEINVRGLAACNKMGVDATATALNNLIKAGYVTRREIREKGRFVRVEYDYSDYLRTKPTLNPDTGTSYQETPNTGIPYWGKPDNKKYQSKEISTKRNIKESVCGDADAFATRTHTRNTRFVKPTVEEIQAYLDEKGYILDAEYFWNFYESKGWMVGKNPMKNWKACVATWVRTDKRRRANNGNCGADDGTEQEDYSYLDKNIWSTEFTADLAGGSGEPQSENDTGDS